MIKEDYISFEVAKLLKEKGFNEATEDFYDSSGKSDDDQALYGGTLKFGRNFWNNDPFIKSGYPKFVTFARPTQSIVLKWLREVHNKYCDIGYDIDLEWYFQIIDLKEIVEYDYPGTKKYHAENETGFKTYEEAVGAALKYVLKNLI